jgi:signal transduction histidine kinase
VTLADGRAVFARSTQISSDLKLIVAREYAERETLLHRIASAFALSSLVVVALMVAAGAWAARRLRRRVLNLNTALRLRETGSVTQGPTGAAGTDELDELATHIGEIVARQSDLVRALRNDSDQTAHELRTPLMHLDLRLQRIIAQSGEGDLSSTLFAARQDIKAIIRMLESLLDIAANEAQRGDMSHLPETNLSDLAINLADLFSESASELGLALETAIAPGVIMRCDAMQMTRMLSNLLDNALKYVPAGGTIRLSVALGPRMSVVDNGPGISSELRENIFVRFRRGGEAGQEGHGLGLALVRAIAERHGLSVRCEDALPGAAFLIAPMKE